MTCRVVQDGRPLFSTARRAYDGIDVVIAAIFHGEWSTVEARVRLGLARARLYKGDEQLLASQVEEAGRQFRYERNLLTARETEAWLESTGVSFEDWTRYLELVVLRRDGADDHVDLAGIERAQVNALSDIEAICSGDLERFSRSFAGRAALHDSHTNPSDVPDHADAADFAASRRACETVFGPSDVERIGLDAWMARIDAHVALEDWYRRFANQTLSRRALDAELENHTLDWTRVRWKRIDLQRESAAREALLCLREDGSPIGEVATFARVAVHDETFLLEEAEPAARTPILAAQPGEVLGPLATADGFRIAVLVAKTAPALEDVELGELAAERIIERLVTGASMRVQWHRAPLGSAAAMRRGEVSA